MKWGQKRLRERKSWERKTFKADNATKKPRNSSGIFNANIGHEEMNCLVESNNGQTGFSTFPISEEMLIVFIV